MVMMERNSDGKEGFDERDFCGVSCVFYFVEHGFIWISGG